MSEHAKKKHEIKILTIVSNKKLISVSYICTYTPSYIYVLTLPAIYIYIYLYLHSQLSVLSSKVGAFSSTIVQTLQNLIKLYIF